MAAPVTVLVGLGIDVGTAMARRFSDEGHKILIADPDAKRLAKASDALPDGTATYHGELHSRLGLRNCLAAALETFGRVDHVLVIPLLPEADALAGVDMEQFDRSLARTARAAVQGVRVFSDNFLEQEELVTPAAERVRQRGTITFILSLTARLPNPGQYSESVTQHAVLGVMKASAVELATENIRCNAIAAIRPRAEDNELWLRQRTPMKRAALADEIAEAALFLTSPGSAIITGETLVLDGGRSQLGGVMDIA